MSHLCDVKPIPPRGLKRRVGEAARVLIPNLKHAENKLQMSLLSIGEIFTPNRLESRGCEAYTYVYGTENMV